MTSDRNPTEALNQALREQRMGGAEKSTLEAISRAIGLPLEIVHRVLYAYETLSDVYPGHLMSPYLDWAEIIPDAEVRAAIEKHMEVGARRYAVRRAIEDNVKIAVASSALVSKSVDICGGCPQQLQCIAESLYTPDQCFNGRLAVVPVTPIRMRKGQVEVQAEQPTGRYVIPLMAVRIKGY